MKRDLLTWVRRTIERHQLFTIGEKLVVGVSGGPDSLCLLHVLHQSVSEYGLQLHAAHLHHGIRGAEADADAAFVRKTAAAWELPCTVERVNVPALAAKPGITLEEIARQARYAFLARLARQIGARTIAVGHNGDDQTETVLMHWLRGAGLAGLRGMLPVTPLDTLRLPLLPVGEQPDTCGLRLVRPLLEVRRSQIEATAWHTVCNPASTVPIWIRPSTATGCATSSCPYWKRTIPRCETSFAARQESSPTTTLCCEPRSNKRGRKRSSPKPRESSSST